MMKVWSAVLVAVLMVGSFDAEARRMGGGGSVGRQSNSVTQREAAPRQAPANPQNGSNAAAPAAAGAAAAPAAAAARKPWMGMLGGLAAGLGLAWLASSLGLGGAFGNILMFALLAFAVVAVIGFFMRRRNGGNAAPSSSPFAFQGAGNGNVPKPETPAQYNPAKVGNDASARPWENQAAAFDARPAGGAESGSMIGSALGGAAVASGTSALAGSQTWGVPAGFDTPGFLAAAKRNFVTLQDAWDRADIEALRSMMTNNMVNEIRTQLSERESHLGGRANKTEVVVLEAQLLGIEEESDGYLASVEFSGMIREEPSAGPSPFREVWNMAKPKDGSAGWLVAGVQALQ